MNMKTTNMKTSKQVSALILLGFPPLLLSACSGAEISEPPTPSAKMVEVVYFARASQPGNEGLPSSATVSYLTSDGAEQRTISSQLNGPDGLEGVAFTVPSGTAFSMNIQNKKKTGLVICAVSVDDVQVSKNSTSTGYGIASCNGVAQ